jgi:hypothetical protein
MKTYLYMGVPVYLHPMLHLALDGDDYTGTLFYLASIICYFLLARLSLNAWTPNHGKSE